MKGSTMVRGWWLASAGVATIAAAGPARAGDKPLYQPAPAWVKAAPAIQTAGVTAESPLILTYDDQERLADGTVWSYRDIATRMATPEVVAKSGTISLAWQPARGDLIVHHVEILRGDQRIDVLRGGNTFTVIRREQQLERLAMDGELTATMAVEGLQVGDVLRVTITTSSRDAALGGAVQDVTLLPAAPAKLGFVRTRLVWPTAQPIRWKSLAEGASPIVTMGGGTSEVVVAGLLPKPAEMPGDVPVSARRLPLLEATSFTGWPAVSKVMARYYATTIAADGALAKEVATIRGAQADPLNRADAALQLVQDKVRYLFNGMNKGNYVPQTPDQTWALRYGDCKAKTVLLLAVLRGLGIEAEPVLANTELGGLLPARLPSAAAFDHVFVRATIADKSYWLDGTGSGARFADLQDTPPFRWVLPIRAQGAELMAVPLQPPVRPSAALAIDVDQRAGVLLTALVGMKLTLRGPLAAQIGLAKVQGTKEQLDAAVQKIVDQMLGGDAVISRYTLAYEPVEGIATVDATATTTGNWEKVADRWRYTLDRTVARMTFDPDRARAAWKDLPVATGLPDRGTIAVRVRLPGDGKGYAFDGDTAFAGPLAQTTIQRDVTAGGGTMAVEDAVTSSGADIARADVAAARARVALAKTRLLAIVAPADLAPRWRQAKDARAAGTLKPVLAAYGDAIARDPEDADGYDNRARFLTGVYDRRAAIPDLNKAIALSPTVARYLTRADAQWALGADAKMLADLKAAHALEPQSFEATVGLAVWLVRHGEREPALALVQERIDAGGTARAIAIAARADLLARAGDKDAALAAADQAVAVKPGDPTLLNDRCWLKARLGMALDTALKDCTKSIELSDSTAAALDSRALVYFRLNRLDDASADLDAALDQRPDSAGSLYLRGIVRARQGKAAASHDDLAAATFIAPRIDAEYAPFGIKP